MNFTGTEKQINWAKDIKAKFDRKIDGIVADQRRRVEEYKDFSAEWLVAVEAAAAKVRAAVEIQTAAKTWIENESRLLALTNQVLMLADKECPVERRIRVAA